MDIVILLPLLVTLAGIYLIIKLRFFYIFHPIRTMRCLLSSLSDSSSRTSLALALAGTLGVGNIVGVALGYLSEDVEVFSGCFFLPCSQSCLSIVKLSWLRIPDARYRGL